MEEDSARVRAEPHRGVVRRKGDGRRAAAASFGLALIASVVLLLAPTGTSISACVQTWNPPIPGAPSAFDSCGTRVSQFSLLESEGPDVALLLFPPVLATGMAWMLQRTRFQRAAALGGAILLFPFVLLGMLSIGIFFFPSTVALLVAQDRDRKDPVPA